MTIDEQIRELEKQKEEETYKLIQVKNEELSIYIQTLKGKYFKHYDGKNMCGQSSFSYFTPISIEICTHSDGHTEASLYGEGLHVTLNFPAIYKHTVYNYDNNIHETIIERGVMTGQKVKRYFKKNKDTDINCATNTIEKQNYTPYGFNEICKSKEDWERKWKEVSKEEYVKVYKVCIETNNYIHNQLYNTCFKSELDNSTSENDLYLILDTLDKNKSDEVIKKIDYLYNNTKDLKIKWSRSILTDLLNKFNE